MSNKDLIAIFEYMEKEKGISRDRVAEAIKESLIVAARSSLCEHNEVDISIDPRTGEIEVLAKKQVVEEVDDPADQISLDDALQLHPESEVGDWLEVGVTPKDFGRIAAQKARQIISSKLRFLEKEVVNSEYRDRIGEVISGTVKRFARRGDIIVDLGKVEALMPGNEYPRGERYQAGDRVVALLCDVQDTLNGGAEVILSRSRAEFVYHLMEQEVPEVSEETIQIVKIVREAGYRTKMTVSSHDERIDPVGACVGMRGARIKNVIRELNNEKIDIIPHSQNPVELVYRALDPIEPKKIDVNLEQQKLTIVVDEEDYPLVIGKRGMNARLCGDLIDCEVEVIRTGIYQRQIAMQRRQLAESEDPSLDEPLQLEGLNQLIVDHLVDAGFSTARKLLQAQPEELAAVPGVTLVVIDQIFEMINTNREANFDQESEA